VRLVLRVIHTFGESLHIDVLRARIGWLGGGGGDFASGKAGGALLALFNAWEVVTAFLTPHEPAIVVAVGVVGALGGGAALLALTTDVLDAATVHLSSLYAALAWLHKRLIVGLLASLWHLFRGQKRNVLRGRVDSADFDVAQLLLGTLLFAVVVFLAPTALVYYAFFLAVFAGVQTVRGALWWAATAVNNAPLYAALCLAAAPARLPDGLQLALVATAGAAPPPARARVRVRVASTLALLRAAADELERGGARVVDVSDDEEEGEEEEDDDGAGAKGGAGGVAPPAPLVTWLRLDQRTAPATILLAPFVDALVASARRFTATQLMRVVFYGEHAASLLPADADEEPGGAGGSSGGAARAAAGDAAASAAAPAPAPAPAAYAASSGLAMGIVNSAANAPIEAAGAADAAAAAAAAAARARQAAFRPRACDIARAPALPPWTAFYAEASALADALCFGAD
jgi:hypothetical protein